MPPTIAAAIAALAFGFLMQLADAKDGEEPDPELARSANAALYLIVLAVSVTWAGFAPSWTAAVNRTFMPIGAAVLAAIAGRYVQRTFHFGRSRRWIVAACLLASIAAPLASMALAA